MGVPFIAVAMDESLDRSIIGDGLADPVIVMRLLGISRKTMQMMM